MTTLKSTDPVPYGDEGEDAIITKALDILKTRLSTADVLQNPTQVKAYLCLQAADKKIETFYALMLDNQHRPIALVEISRGTINQATVYPREVVRAVIEWGACAVILTHNHPSGNPEPSQQDIKLTTTLKKALDLIDVRVLDHVVTAGEKAVSMVEKGLL